MGVYGYAGMRIGFVYFAQVADPPGQPIKIGWSVNPWYRVHELSTGSPSGDLVIARVIRGTIREERALHERFAHLRIRREWFKADPELCNFVNALPDPLDERVA